jgi:hypothetical protein
MELKYELGALEIFDAAGNVLVRTGVDIALEPSGAVRLTCWEGVPDPVGATSMCLRNANGHELSRGPCTLFRL